MRRAFCWPLSGDILRSVGAHEQREAAIAVGQAKCHRGLALLVRSYREIFRLLLLT